MEGDIQQLPSHFPVVPLWQVLAGQAVGRESAAQVTVFDSVGFALEDYSALRLVHRLATELGLGQDVDLVPQADDPKDLFRFTRSPSALRRVA
jgi:ornithine cyclodeaminase